ncbi:MAG: stage 0 sporulation protein [Coprobacillus sp.]|nr:stage 0 sporulation protein [Coprobacillus sp.]
MAEDEEAKILEEEEVSDEREEILEDVTQPQEYTNYVGVKFSDSLRMYFFGYKDMDLKTGDKVVVETTKGVELGEITTPIYEMVDYKLKFALKPIIRKATDQDIRDNENNLKDAEYALSICAEEIKNLGLDMRLLKSEYTLDRSKLSFTYLADERVDFRELLRVLASHFHTRIELRQIGPRDKARNVGGLGICGLPLCCSTFLDEFDGISINRAKNQLLTINIPKLSGQCGKLICCLKYEDDVYTELRQAFPDLGNKIWRDDEEYTVSSINVISRMVELKNEENVLNIPLEEYDKLVSAKRRKPEHEEE